jgi:inorganic pyrophosphatase
VTAGDVSSRSLVKARLVDALRVSEDDDGQMARNNPIIAIASKSRIFQAIGELAEMRVASHGTLRCSSTPPTG